MVSFNVTAPAVFVFIVASLPRLIVALRRSSLNIAQRRARLRG